jgi:hypothetical protein
MFHISSTDLTGGIIIRKKYHVLFDTIELSNKDLKTTSDSDHRVERCHGTDVTRLSAPVEMTHGQLLLSVDASVVTSEVPPRGLEPEPHA